MSPRSLSTLVWLSLCALRCMPGSIEVPVSTADNGPGGDSDARDGDSPGDEAVLIVELLPADAVLALGETVHFTAVPAWSDGTPFSDAYSVAWLSTEPSVVAVTDGVAEGLVAGSCQVQATVRLTVDGREASAAAQVTVTGGVALRYNAGAAWTTIFAGREFQPLLPLLTGGVAHDSNEGIVGGYAISGTVYDALYQDEVWVEQSPATFTFALPNGEHTVHLHFADWHRDEPGDRTFHVELQGARVLDSFDAIATVGKSTAVIRSFDTVVTDGTLSLGLVNEVFYANLAAVEILPRGVPALPLEAEVPPECGDQACEAPESCSTCPADCGSCPDPGASCGRDGCQLGAGENCATCPSDCGVCPSTGYGAEFFVSPTGDDGNAGTVGAPFATLEAARDAIRALRSGAGLPNGGVVVWLRGGTHERSTTFALEGQDSGAPGKPIVYRSYPGELASLIGGRRLDVSAFALLDSAHPAWSRLDPAARGQVWVANLPALGLVDFGTLKVRGYGVSAVAGLELSFAGNVMTLARWPDEDATSGTDYPGYVNNAGAVSDTQFHYAGTRPERWGAATDIWVHGYWAEWWSDQHLPLLGINTASQTISVAEAPIFGIGSGMPYYVYNLLEELTVAGEWVLERSTGDLFLWPPAPLDDQEIVVSVLEGPIVRLSDAAHVRLEDLQLSSSRDTLVRIDGGTDNAIRRCRLVNAGSHGVVISGARNGIERSEVAFTGDKGVILTGGQRASLSRADNYVTQTHLHHFGRWGRTYQQAVEMLGCGQIVTHNQIHHAPHSAIEFRGNEHTIEYNDIYEVCLFSSDSGAIYSGRDWGYRGNVVRYNFVHHIDSPFPGFGEHGVYMDDALAGVLVFGNVFYQVSGYAIEHGGGRDAIMDNNIIARCGSALLTDSRGIQKITNIPGDSWNFLERLTYDGVQYQADPWATRYPELAIVPFSWAVVGDDGLTWRYPEGSVFARNVGFANDTWIVEQTYGGTGTLNKFDLVGDNLENVDPLFVDEAGLDLGLLPASPALDIPGFVPIPFSEIGIQPAL